MYSVWQSIEQPVAGPSNQQDYQLSQAWTRDFYNQMEYVLVTQIKKAEYWRDYFKQFNNHSMANQFSTQCMIGRDNLFLLRQLRNNDQPLPMFRFMHMTFTAIPANGDIAEDEIQLTIKASDLPISHDSICICVAEFDHPLPEEESIKETHDKLKQPDKKNLVDCVRNPSKLKQYDVIQSTKSPPFYDTRTKRRTFTRPLSFTISYKNQKKRNERIKFNRIKLTFFEKKVLWMNKRIGSASININDINDSVAVLRRVSIFEGRKELDAAVDIRVSVRQPLFNRSIRPHEEKFMILT